MAHVIGGYGVMDVKLVAVVLVVLAMVVEHQVRADFWYNHVPPKFEGLDSLGLKCVPGRTVVKIEQRDKPRDDSESSYEDEDGDYEDENEESESNVETRRTHMNAEPKDETCQICVCSTEGKDEHCSKRPARNVNECIRMGYIMEQFNKNIPYDHERTLAGRIRRDYIWHKDEIPYDSHAKCKRGFSYYTNSITANDTDIEVPSDLESLLDYNNKDVCFYCVCSVHGDSVGCISRDPWFCEYFRHIREDNQPRDMYRDLFEQDRPAYFRQLSHRIRRTMDDGIFVLLDSVNDVDMMSSCVPFVSQYTDCTEDNLCTGCTKCDCTVQGQWSCERVSECQKETRSVDDRSLDRALHVITSELKNKKSKTSSKKQRRLQKYPDEIILVNNDHIEDKILSLITRQKRSANFKTNNDGRDSNNSVRFYHTLDEINEDTLKNSNLSGTLEAKKVILSPELTRRHGVLSHSNLTNMNSLHIEYKQPKIYNHHIADNKIDTSHVEEKYDVLVGDKIHDIVGNHTNELKDKDVSKIVVNELKNGTEILGNKKGPVMSNITFTPENDTLTAMAFIAGNLLNRLWELEKDRSDSFETEVLKHDKITDLLDLFKEPHTLKQEGFIRTALEKISEAIDRNKDIKNISLCENVEAAKKVINNSDSPNETSSKDCANRKKNDGGDDKLATKQAIQKINTVLDLIKTFEVVQKNLLDLKQSSVSNKMVETMKKDPKTDKLSSQDLFYNLLEKITKLLMPHNQKVAKKIKSQSRIVEVENFKAKFKQMYNIDLGNVTLTPKDKLLLNYLNKIEKSPRCLLGSLNNNDEKSIRKVEGDILLNLSEFFKMKSFVDLMKMLEPEKKDSLRTYEVTTLKSWQVARNMSTVRNNSNRIDNGTFVDTKEKLKAHLKVILDDLIEIQKEKQLHGNNLETNLANALPCIYKALNSDSMNLENYATNDKQKMPINKIISVFDSLKNDLRFNSETRRTATDDQQRPASSFVWERVINSLNSKYNKISRRNLYVQTSKTYEEIKKEINKIDASSNSYKTYDFLAAVPPADRLILLKTINMDVKKYKNVLEDIKNSYGDLEKLPPNKWNEICDFIENAGMQLSLDKNLFNTLKNSDERKRTGKAVKNRTHKEVSDNNMSTPKRYINNVKLSRDQILNHIIKNRVQLYIKQKEAIDDHVEDDINYNIAKKILAYLENGNNELAKELYKVFVIHKKSSTSNNKIESLSSNINQSMRVPTSYLYKRPLLQFEEPPNNMNIQPKMINQESLLKQLLNIKNL